MDIIEINNNEYWVTDTMTEEDRDRIKHVNNYNWYLVDFEDGTSDIRHDTALSSILQCGHDPQDYGIINMEQCG